MDALAEVPIRKENLQRQKVWRRQRPGISDRMLNLGAGVIATVVGAAALWLIR